MTTKNPPRYLYGHVWNPIYIASSDGHGPVLTGYYAVSKKGYYLWVNRLYAEGRWHEMYTGMFMGADGKSIITETDRFEPMTLKLVALHALEYE